ncbi:MAG TPA: Usg family protein [Geminicoccaceae bacterium]|nr:Usg family protein [Geminicoccus sp.]HMU48883.1 Usg family protein [Geminicoccaceae bacterium]
MQVDRHEAMKLQLQGYRLATAEILYRLPDHPSVLQTFVWQHYDIQPKFPVLRRFLDYWTENIEGPLHSVRVTRLALLTPAGYRSVAASFQLH